MPPIRKWAGGVMTLSRAHPFSFPANLRLWTCCRRARCAPHSGGIAVIAVVVLVALSTPFADAGTTSANPPNAVPLVASIAESMTEASQRFDIPTSWLRVVIRAESAGDPHAVSPKGAMGLMQIMPGTWASLRLRYALGTDPFDAHDNILAGAAYLRELHDRYGAPGFLAAYDAGPTRYDAYLATGRPLPKETLAYVDHLAPLITKHAVGRGAVLAAATGSWLRAPLFVVHSDSVLIPPRSWPELHDRQSPIVVRLADLTGLMPQSNGLFAAISQQGGSQ